jgi:hypothetical protein
MCTYFCAEYCRVRDDLVITVYVSQLFHIGNFKLTYGYCILTTLPDDRMILILIRRGLGIFLLRHHVQNGSGAYPASYQMDIGGSFPGGKAAGARS